MSIQTFISVDTETGGLFPEQNPLLQIGMGVYALDTATLVYTTVCEQEWNLKPSQFTSDGKLTIEPQAISVNHLDLEAMERDGYLVEDMVANIGNVLAEAKKAGGRIHILGQNYAFDRGFLHKYLPDQIFHELDLNVQVDLLTVSQSYNSIVSPDWDNPPSRSLGSMCQRLGVKNDTAHTALSDAKATFMCYVALQKRFREAGRIIQINQDLALKHNELKVLLSNMT